MRREGWVRVNRFGNYKPDRQRTGCVENCQVLYFMKCCQILPMYHSCKVVPIRDELYMS